MRLSLRFLLPLAVVLAGIAYAVIPLVDTLTLKWFVRDLEIRSKLVASTIEAPLAELVTSESKRKILAYFHRIIQDERLYALGFCDSQNRLLYKTQTYPDEISCEGAASLVPASSEVFKLSHGLVHVAAAAIQAEGRSVGRLMLVHDMGFVQRRSTDTKWYIFYLFVALGAAISLVTVLVAHLSWKGWVAGVRAMLRGEGLLTPLGQDHGPELQPVAKDLRALIRDLEADRRMRDEAHITWSATSLRTILHEQLAGDEILIVSNRQPYIHNRRDDRIETQMPASGVVAALEPVMRACSGIWIAHGNGSADREVVDSRDHIRVPPDNPAYEIRRIWLTPEEEAGYYYGFANEGLWPLCHMAHIRPTFRSSDWKQYVAINERFARAVQEEAKTDDPVVLVQDYHFALLPKMIRERLPNATVLAFWHIPLPNPEQYGICPETDMPYRERFDSSLAPSAAARQNAAPSRAQNPRVHWIKRWSEKPGVSDDHLREMKQTLAAGWPIAAGSSHRCGRGPEYSLCDLGEHPVAQADSLVECGSGMPAEQISAGEQVFEIWRKRLGVVLTPAVFFLTYFLCDGLTPEGRKLAAILSAVGVLWISEVIPLPVSALLGAVLCVVG